MLISCWSVKGGVGTSVFAAAFALSLAASSPTGALLVDLGGDLPAVLGLPEPRGDGLMDWLRAGAAVPADGLAHLEVSADPQLGLLPRGAVGPVDSRGRATGTPVAAFAERAEVLAGVLAVEPRHVIVDCGVLHEEPSPVRDAGMALAAGATHSWLVTRACYLGVRRAAASPLRPSAFVLVREPGRSLRAADIEAVLGVPLAAEVAVEPSVARAVDSGLLGARPPRVHLHTAGEVT